MPAYDPIHNYKVFAPGAGQLLNGVADSVDVMVQGNNLLLMAAVGGQGCVDPSSPIYGCYRMQIFSSTVALGTDIFTNLLESPDLPFNPQEYSRIVIDPTGNQFVLGHYFPPATNGSPVPVNTIPNPTAMIMALFPISTSALQFGSVDPAPAPNPTYATADLSTKYSTLQQFQLACSESNPIPDSSNSFCFSAVHRYCQSQGYELGGLLEQTALQQTSGSFFAVVSCERGTHGASLVVNIGALSAYQSPCTMSTLISGWCASAINRYCKAAGYDGGGFGPMEQSGGNVMINCVDGVAFSQVLTTFNTLISYQSGCSASWTSSASCYSAVDDACRALGFLNGYGILEQSGSSALMGCVRENITN